MLLLKGTEEHELLTDQNRRLNVWAGCVTGPACKHGHSASAQVSVTAESNGQEVIHWSWNAAIFVWVCAIVWCAFVMCAETDTHREKGVGGKTGQKGREQIKRKSLTKRNTSSFPGIHSYQTESATSCCTRNYEWIQLKELWWREKKHLGLENN